MVFGGVRFGSGHPGYNAAGNSGMGHPGGELSVALNRLSWTLRSKSLPMLVAE